MQLVIGALLPPLFNLKFLKLAFVYLLPDFTMSNQAAAGKTASQAAQKGVLIKLLIFSLSLGIIPITSYFVTEKYVWNGNSNYAAITAIFVANGVLFAYIVSSLWEDKISMQIAEQKKLQPSESRKNQ